MRSAVLLCPACALTFGAERSVISLLPTYRNKTFGLHIAAAGTTGSVFTFANLVTRPGGGVSSDVQGRRRATLVRPLLGVMVSVAVVARTNPNWSTAAGVAPVMVASVFVQGGNGAIVSIVPAIYRQSAYPRHRVTNVWMLAHLPSGIEGALSAAPTVPRMAENSSADPGGPPRSRN